ncbi:MAG: hypothetical protein Q8Q39_01655, partial [bacterium]|nr:hypothetical protein [bacterium]
MAKIFLSLPKSQSTYRIVAITLLISLAASIGMFGVHLRSAQAAALTDYSDTLSDSDRSASSAHTIRFTTTNS